jgi:tRNA threonylcarbamoyladenosine biosynthesis protein TsaE
MEVRGVILVSSNTLLKKYISKDPDETKNIGFQLGSILKPGDVVGLYGELGTGKTTMVKGIARAFGIDERDIVSASFTIIAEYGTEPRFHHIDLYRIDKDHELAELGLRDYIGGDFVSVIEWAEKAGGDVPEDIISVHIKSLGEYKREITIEGINEEGRHNR